MPSLFNIFFSFDKFKELYGTLSNCDFNANLTEKLLYINIFYNVFQ
jgi:hypothetical protein